MLTAKVILISNTLSIGVKVWYNPERYGAAKSGLNLIIKDIYKLSRLVFL